MTTDLEARLADWHRRKYGDGPVKIDKTFLKAVNEMGELAEALLAGDAANVIEEAADVAITLAHLVRGLGGSLTWAMAAKLDVLFQRLVTGKEPKHLGTWVVAIFGENGALFKWGRDDDNEFPYPPNDPDALGLAASIKRDGNFHSVHLLQVFSNGQMRVDEIPTKD